MNSKKSQINKRLSLLAWSTIILFLFLLALSVPAVIRDWNNLQNSNSETLNEKREKFNASLEIVKAIVNGAGTVATVAGGFVLYLNFREANRNTEIANRNAEIAVTRLITERFSKAVEQLGSEKIEVCLGGIYSLEKIATESAIYHWTIIEVLTAFIRERNLAHTSSKTPIEDASIHRAVIQAALTVIGRRNVDEDPHGKELDLSNSNLSGFTISGSFSKAKFRNSIFHSSKFQGVDANFENADFSNADLEGAELSGANFKSAIFIDANLNSTKIVKGSLESARLAGAFLREAVLDETNLEKADLTRVYIAGTVFRKTKLKDSTLSQAHFWTEKFWGQRHYTEEDHHLADLSMEEQYSNHPLYNEEESRIEQYEEYDQIRRPVFESVEGLESKQILTIDNHTEIIYNGRFYENETIVGN